MPKLNSVLDILKLLDKSNCRECGSPVGPRSMINRVIARMPSSGGLLPQLELCPGCRAKAMLSQM